MTDKELGTTSLNERERGEDDTKAKAINEVAAKQLQLLLVDLEEVMADQDLLGQHEIDFLGDLYARMIVSALMGHYPNRMADDAEDAAHRLHEMAKEQDNDAEGA